MRAGAGTPRAQGRAVAKRLSQARRLELSLAMQTTHGLSARRADRALRLSRSARHYCPRVRDDGPLIALIEAHLKDNPGHGFGLLFDCALRAQGWGKTRAWRVYTALKLNLPRRGKRRLPDRIREPLEIPQLANHTWSADFMADALWSGRQTHLLKIGDLQFDPVTGAVHRQGERLHPTPTGLKLLRVLMEAAPQLVSRAELEACLWGQNSALMSETNVRKQIHALRAIVDKPFDTLLIRTYHSLGYRLAVSPSRQHETVAEGRVSATVLSVG